jgi:hypothetical protein
MRDIYLCNSFPKGNIGMYCDTGPRDLWMVTDLII